ncbi:hypothetical protein OROMI_025382 [Orobanche minor]
MDRPKSPPPSPPHATTSATPDNRSLENIKSLLIKCATASAPAKKSLTPLHKAFIEKRIQEIFPDIHTPDHPPYAWMIENAIRQLNREGGSSEEAISKFLLEEYKDLPFAHAALLNHHLRKLSESDDLVRNHKGCYSISISRTLLNRASVPNPNITDTTTLVPVLSPSPTPSPSPSPSPGCSSPSYESSSTYSSSDCLSQKRKGRKMKKKKKVKRKKSRNARGTKFHTNHNSGLTRGRSCGGTRSRGRGLGRGRGRGRGRGPDSGCCKPEDAMTEVCANQVENGELRRNHMEALEIQYPTVEDEVGDENIGVQDSVGAGSPALESVMVIKTGPLARENRVNEERIEPLPQKRLIGGENSSLTSVIRSLRKKKIISEPGSKNVRPRKRSIRLKPSPQVGRRRRGRSRERDVQMEEYGNNNMAITTDGKIEQVDDDSLDELIEQVYMELKKASEIQKPTAMEIQGNSRVDESTWTDIQEYHCEGMQCKLNLQRDIIDLEPTEQEYHYHVDDSLKNDKHLEKDVSSGALVVYQSEESRRTGIEKSRPRDVIYKDIEEVEPLEREHEFTDAHPNEMQLQECTFGTPNGPDVVIEQKLRNEGRISWTEEQNYSRQIEESKEMGIKRLKMEDDTSKKVEPLVEPQSRQLQPQPPKFQQDQTERQFGLSTPDKSRETNQCRKLRSRPSNNESNEVGNRAESWAARHSLQER